MTPARNSTWELTLAATIHPGSQCHAEEASHVRQTSNLRVQGTPGDRALLILGTEGNFQSFGAFQGVLHLERKTAIPMGTIPANGLLTFPFTHPNLPTGLEAETVHGQVVLFTPREGAATAIRARTFFFTNPKVWIVRQ